MEGEFKVFMVATVPRLCLEETGFSLIDDLNSWAPIGDFPPNALKTY